MRAPLSIALCRVAAGAVPPAAATPSPPVPAACLQTMRAVCGNAVCLGELCKECETCMLTNEAQFAAAGCSGLNQLAFCQNGSAGGLAWDTREDLQYSHASFLPGFSAPAIDAQRGVVVAAISQYTTSYFGVVKGYNATTGSELWCVPQPCGLSVIPGQVTAVTVDGGAAFFGSGRTDGLQNTSLNAYAVDAATGSVRWAREACAQPAGAPASAACGGVMARPVVAGGVAYFAYNRLDALDAATGQLLWRWPTYDECTVPAARTDCSGYPGGSMTPEQCEANGCCYESRTPAPAPAPVPPNSSALYVCVGTTCVVQAGGVDLQTCERMCHAPATPAPAPPRPTPQCYRKQALPLLQSAAAVAGGAAYALLRNSTGYALLALNATTGKEMWTRKWTGSAPSQARPAALAAGRMGVYFVDRAAASPSAVAVHAVALDAARPAWASDPLPRLGVPPLNTAAAAWSAPTASDTTDAVFVGGAGVRALAAANGSVAWHYRAASPAGYTWWFDRPVVAGGVVYCGAKPLAVQGAQPQLQLPRACVVALDERTGSFLGSYNGPFRQGRASGGQPPAVSAAAVGAGMVAAVFTNVSTHANPQQVASVLGGFLVE